jgi:hypothetical protein
MGFNFKKILSLILVLSFVSPAYGREELAPAEPLLPSFSLGFQAPTAEKPVLNVSMVDETEEEGLLREMAIDEGKNILVYYNGDRDPLFRFVLSNADLRAKVTLVDASEAQPSLKDAKQSKIWKGLKALRSQSTGILVAAGTAGLFAAPFYFSSGLNVATQIYGAAFTIFTLQAVFTQQWQKLLSLGGRATSALHGLVRKALKKNHMEAPAAVEDMGRMATAFTFNAGTATLFLNLSGQYDSVWTVLTLASLGVYDITWDLVVTRLQELHAVSEKGGKRFIQSRIVAGALLDSLAIVVAGPMLWAMAGFLSTGMISLFGAKSLSMLIERYKEGGLKSLLPQLKKRWKDRIFLRARCRRLLVPYEGVA